MKDPLNAPVLVETPELDKLLEKLLSPETLKLPGNVVISGNTKTACVVDGSIAGPPCEKCGTPVWLAPSSQRFREPVKAAVCVECLVAQMELTRRQA